MTKYEEVIKELRERAMEDAQREEKAYWEAEASDINCRVHLAMRNYHNGFYEGLGYALPLATALDKQYAEKSIEFTSSKGKIHFITNDQIDTIKYVYDRRTNEKEHDIIKLVLNLLEVEIEGVNK